MPMTWSALAPPPSPLGETLLVRRFRPLPWALEVVGSSVRGPGTHPLAAQGVHGHGHVPAPDRGQAEPWRVVRAGGGAFSSWFRAARTSHTQTRDLNKFNQVCNLCHCAWMALSEGQVRDALAAFGDKQSGAAFLASRGCCTFMRAV